MNKQLLLVFFLMIAFESMWGQKVKDGREVIYSKWYQGKLLLASADTLQGLITYDLQTNVMEYLAKDYLGKFNPQTVLYFELYDSTTSGYRKFYSLPYSNASVFKTTLFFELLAEGKITLLARQKFYHSYSLTLEDQFFVLLDDGIVMEKTRKKMDWLSMMGVMASDVDRYARDNKLLFDDKYGLTCIIEYYNSFFAKK